MNKLLDKAFLELKNKKLDACLINISNENLYEFVSLYDNYIVDLTDFKGDTGRLLIMKNKAYLMIDGRFIVEAKQEINDKRIKIELVDRFNSDIDFYKKVLKPRMKLGINYKTNSIHKVNELKILFAENKIIVKDASDFLKKEFRLVKSKTFHMTSAPLFVLDEKYVGESAKEKISSFANDSYYVTGSSEEIGYLTNLRYRFCDIARSGVLFDAFMIVNKKKSYLYIKDYLEDEAKKYLSKNNIEVKLYDTFYGDLKRIKNKEKIFLDKKLNNYYMYDFAKLSDKNFIDSPLIMSMSIKNDVQRKNLIKCNLLDGVAITKALYNVKHKKYKNEYDIKKMVDATRKICGGKYYLCESFDTIVAYKENSAICHYSPDKNNSKKISDNSLLLIDSGGNYLYGTTDITRTISLYKNKNNIPPEIKKHYTLVLNAMLKLAMQVFPYGVTGSELDMVCRSSLYNEYLDFNHGTGHGIGYISNVHEGPNRISPGIHSDYKNNIMEVGQLVSDEPGLYFEGKYGIRIENDLLVVDDKNNEFGEFVSFKTMTLCPYDIDLIDKNYLEKASIDFLNKYNSNVYKKLSPHLTKEEKDWLRYHTKIIK